MANHKPDIVLRSVSRLLRAGATGNLQRVLERQHPSDLALIFRTLREGDRRTAFDALARRNPKQAMEALAELEMEAAAELLLDRDAPEIARLLGELHADDAARLIEGLPQPLSQQMRDLMQHREDVGSVLEHADRSAGRIMNPNVFALAETATAGEAVSALQRSAGLEMVFYLYVVDRDGHLVGVTSLRRLLIVPPDTPLGRIMTTEVVRVRSDMDQEEAARLVAAYNLLAVPVVDSENKLVGTITVDDVIDVIKDETTEDIQKLGGLEALDEPYMETPFWTLVKKRGRWLVVLFLGEMLTATAMGYFEAEIARAVVLALFVPLIISSGGNSGSQAASLMIRALAVGEITIRDWWRVMRRELMSGAALGVLLGTVGIVRVSLWQKLFGAYGPHWFLVAVTVMLSLIGVVLWGTLAGSMLPFVMKRIGADPATSSAPFVATLVDVTGLLIYFSIAAVIMRGTLL
jgi:magnesium transporter